MPELKAVTNEKPGTQSHLTNQLTVSVVALEMVRLTKLLDEAIQELYQHSADWAKLDNDYRHLKASSYLASDEELRVADREMLADQTCKESRYLAHLSQAMKDAATENVRARRTQLQALQSLMVALKAEMDLAR